MNRFIYSKGVTSLFYDDGTHDPTSEEEFNSLLTLINESNKYNPAFPLKATFEEFSSWLIANPPKPSPNPALINLKQMRNILLQQSDWLLTYDNTQSLANLNEWISYRQKLRDFFSNPDFSLITIQGTTVPDMAAMNFPPPMPPVIRK
jgi:Uma2 family endonuclease